MLFHPYREGQNSFYLEFQYCDYPKDAPIKGGIVSVSNIVFRRYDSLYVHGADMFDFYDLYKTIFCNGFYNNGKRGVVDMWGINYYPPEEASLVVKRVWELVQERGSEDDRTLLKWLESVEQHNGFWILGI